MYDLNDEGNFYLKLNVLIVRTGSGYTAPNSC